MGNLQVLLQIFDIMHCVVAFVKGENNNLTSMAITLCSIVDIHPLKFLWVYEVFILVMSCLKHVNMVQMMKGWLQV